MRLDGYIERGQAEAARSTPVARKLLRGGWLFLLFAALLAVSPASSPGAMAHGVPSLTSSSPELAAVIHQASAYDVAAAARIVRHWKSRQPDHAGAAALAPVPFALAPPPQGSTVHDGRFTEVAWSQPFRHFDSQAPPSSC